MSAIQRISDRMCLADVVAFDRDDKPVLVVAAEEQLIYPVVLYSYLEVLSAIRKDIPFAFLAFARTHETRNHAVSVGLGIDWRFAGRLHDVEPTRR